MKITLRDIAQFHHLDLIARQLVDGFITGLHKSPYHGFSVEFAEHKLYNSGESTRHIDWKVYARTDKLFTKQYEEETNLRCHLLVDTSASMHYPLPDKSKLKFAILSAASVAYLLVKQRDAVGLTLFDDRVHYQSPQKSTQIHLDQLLTTLGDTLQNTPDGQTNIGEVLHEVADKIPRRSLVVLFTDMFQAGATEELFQALQHLKHNLHEVIVFQITDDATERDFDFPDRPTRFVDVETKEMVKLNPYLVRDKYQAAMDRFYEEVRVKCGMLKIDFVKVDCSQSFDKVLGAFLIKRKRMR